MKKQDILHLMRSTGCPCVVSGMKVKRWRFRHTDGWLQTGVAPTLQADPGAYKATVAGHTVPIRSVLSLLKDHPCLLFRRRTWKIRGRFYLQDQD